MGRMTNFQEDHRKGTVIVLVVPTGVVTLCYIFN